MYYVTVLSNKRVIKHYCWCLITLLYLFGSSSCKHTRSDVPILEKDTVICMDNAPELWGNVLYGIEEKENLSLFYFSREKKTLSVYIKDGLSFKKESDQLLDNRYNNVYVKSRDTILLFHDHTGKCMLLNSAQQILDTFTIPLCLDSMQYMISSNSSTNIVFQDEKLILGVLPCSTLETFFNHYYEIAYDLTKHRVESHFLKFPPQYTARSWWYARGNRYAKCYHQGDIIYSFPMENSLYKYAKNKIEKIEVKPSAYFSTFPPPSMDLLKDYPPDYVSVYVDTIPYYQSLYFDPYRKVYLRIAAHAQPASYVDQKTKTLKRNLFFDRVWSILFFDSDFKFIGEQKFEKQIFFYIDIFITKEGILVPFAENAFEKGKQVKFQLFKYKNPCNVLP